MPLIYWFDEVVDKYPGAKDYWPDVEQSNALFLHQVERVAQLEVEVESLQRQLKSLTERRRHVENLQSSLWERASAYTNLILSAGYAALFASWGALRGELSTSISLWIILLALCSLLAFVTWEVVKMLVASTVNNGLISVLQSDDSSFEQRLLIQNAAAARTNWKLQLAWRPILVWTVFTGLSSAALLIISVAHRAIQG